jgi:tetratricopeptide (TPR) repeat protein
MSSLLQRVFPFLGGPEAKLERARKLLARGEYMEARWAVVELEHPAAAELLAQADAGLRRLNLDEAEARFRTHDDEGGREHMELARSFGATDADLRSVRQAARLAREELQREADQAAAQEDAVLVPEPQGSDALWSLPPDDPRLRFAMLVEAYPDGLRERLLVLGRSFAEAVLEIDGGDPERAYALLTPFVGQEPAARFERARAALAARKLEAAVSDLQAFGQALGHQRVGTMHTGIVLGQLLGQLGRQDDALDVVDSIGRSEPGAEALGLRAALLESTGRFADAEEAAVGALTLAPGSLGLYRLLARVRVRQGNRLAAMQALEAGLTRCCGSPGKCGTQPLDADAVRMLAGLYLEDRIEPKRTRELLTQLQGIVERPQWEDRYLMALTARNERDPAAGEIAQRVVAELPANDPRRASVMAALNVQLALAG